jgi:hypothetical protein
LRHPVGKWALDHGSTDNLHVDQTREGTLGSADHFEGGAEDWRRRGLPGGRKSSDEHDATREADLQMAELHELRAILVAGLEDLRDILAEIQAMGKHGKDISLVLKTIEGPLMQVLPGPASGLNGGAVLLGPRSTVASGGLPNTTGLNREAGGVEPMSPVGDKTFKPHNARAGSQPPGEFLLGPPPQAVAAGRRQKSPSRWFLSRRFDKILSRRSNKFPSRRFKNFPRWRFDISPSRRFRVDRFSSQRFNKSPSGRVDRFSSRRFDKFPRGWNRRPLRLTVCPRSAAA